MWRNRTKLSWRDILNLGLGQCTVAEVSAQKGWSVQIDLPSQNFGELALKAEKIQARYEIGLKFYEHVHIAARLEIVAQDRPEQRQLPYVMPAAKLRNAVSRNFYSRASHLAPNSFSLKILRQEQQFNIYRAAAIRSALRVESHRSSFAY
jgi:hypothetical protein